MRVLYAIQGTGNGHLSRAHEIVPLLKKYVDVDTLISGNQAQINADFDIDFQRTGLTFLSGKNGDISIWKSLKNSKVFMPVLGCSFGLLGLVPSYRVLWV